MEDNNKRRIFVILPGIIMFSIYLIWLIAMIPFFVFFVRNHDAWFWSLIVAIILMCLLMIWGIIVTAQYADVDYNGIRLVSYKEICDIKMTDIDLIEVRKSSIGHVNIIIKTKEPIRLFKRNNTPKNKFTQEFGFIHSKKLVRIFKHYLPEEITWIYNDYYKNPNLEPKRNKKK